MMSESLKSKRLRAKKLARIRFLRGIKECKKALKELEAPTTKGGKNDTRCSC